MYTLDTPITHISGVGQTTADKLIKHEIQTVKDLLLYAPLRYLDASQVKTIIEIRQLTESMMVTTKAVVLKVSQFRRGKKSIQTALIQDDTGQLKLMFFNSPFVLTSLKKGQTYFFSGRYSPDYQNLTQPKFEPVKKEQIHTGRLVPYYSTRLNLAQGNLRRLIKKVLDNLGEIDDVVIQVNKPNQKNLTLNQTFHALHFPKKPIDVMKARKRLALEEILSIIDYSEATKLYLKHQQNAPVIQDLNQLDQLIQKLPFQLTNDQKQAINDITDDLSQPYPMNRLLMGDVGTGKTVVAGLAASLVTGNHFHTAFIAPTTILAKQHQQALKKLLPELNIKLVTAQNKFQKKDLKTPTLFIGTHALINRLNEIQPGLIIYDEQQKFGVWQRGQKVKKFNPHILNMTATPIPRSLMLTIFSHVSLSTIKTYPQAKPPVKTWVVPAAKRSNAFKWLKQELTQDSQAILLVVAPFIDPSYHQALENVKAVKEVFAEYQAHLKEFHPTMLHGRMKKAEQSQVIANLRQGKTRVLVATPMIEVGIDLPEAKIMIIESAERFGLSSLHQLRGRVGRRGQEAFCLLFAQTKQPDAIDRLTQFSQLNDGEKIAELDLKYRGGGDIFGVNQHGLANLKFSSWLNPKLIQEAKELYNQLPKSWQSFLSPQVKVSAEHLN